MEIAGKYIQAKIIIIYHCFTGSFSNYGSIAINFLALNMIYKTIVFNTHKITAN